MPRQIVVGQVQVRHATICIGRNAMPCADGGIGAPVRVVGPVGAVRGIIECDERGLLGRVVGFGGWRGRAGRDR